jgi:hypothetical protein
MKTSPYPNKQGNVAPVQVEHAHVDGARRQINIDGASVLKVASSTGTLSFTETSILGVSEERRPSP